MFLLLILLNAGALFKPRDYKEWEFELGNVQPPGPDCLFKQMSAVSFMPGLRLQVHL